jgi:hypothetical protein
VRPADALADIRDFIEKLRLDGASIDPGSKVARTLYRRFHGLLIWHHLGSRDEIDEQTRTYLHECVADASAAYFLTIIGLYKAGRASLRSSIENVYRVVVAEAREDLSQFDSVPLLLAKAKDVSKTPNQNVRIGDLYGLYGKLCLTVHSVSPEYMSLKVPFEALVTRSQSDADANFSMIESAFKVMNDLLFIELAHYLNLIDYKNADLLRDAVEAVVKGEAAALTV